MLRPKFKLDELLNDFPIPIKEIKIRCYKKPSVHVNIWFKPTEHDPKGGFMSIKFGNVTREDFLQEHPEFEKYIVS